MTINKLINLHLNFFKLNKIKHFTYCKLENFFLELWFFYLTKPSTVVNNILIVEDDITIGEKIFSEVKNIECISQVELSTTLKEAKNNLKSNHFDIIVLDLNLPDGNGIQLLRWLKEKKAKTKIFIFSINIELKRLCLQSGADGFFDKSKDFDALLEHICEN